MHEHIISSVIESSKLYDSSKNEKNEEKMFLLDNVPDERHMVREITREITYLEHLLDSGLTGALVAAVSG